MDTSAQPVRSRSTGSHRPGSGSSRLRLGAQRPPAGQGNTNRSWVDRGCGAVASRGEERTWTGRTGRAAGRCHRESHGYGGRPWPVRLSTCCERSGRLPSHLSCSRVASEAVGALAASCSSRLMNRWRRHGWPMLSNGSRSAECGWPDRSDPRMGGGWYPDGVRTDSSPAARLRGMMKSFTCA